MTILPSAWGVSKSGQGGFHTDQVPSGLLLARNRSGADHTLNL
jgi:hypothetical protein